MLCGLNWEDIVIGAQVLFQDDFGSKSGVYRSYQVALWHAGPWKPRFGMAGCILWHAGVCNPHRSVAGCIFGYTIAWDCTL